MNKKIRELEDNLASVLNSSDIPIECKRIILENLMIKCEAKANDRIQEEISGPITEEGDLNEPKLD